ncbi:hypothetical protein [Polyangium aurulentum]|uniref:hypothetical protein n=1 Tax=Polyangium aurulentum TaxID=2567896 RepID=UPI0010ADD866|nr:hypothetical protein [Polyangium aurulentum]UQA59409.1 hypothetical protein E8A73_002545 [Polyangium aurulentum]
MDPRAVRLALATALALAGCAEPAPSAAPRPPASVFSPDAAPHAAPVDPGDGGAQISTTPDKAALDEILAAAPRLAARPTGPDGGTLVGTSTDAGAEPADVAAPAPMPNAPVAEPVVEEGKPEVQPGLPSSSIERAARAQLYYPLVTRCKDRDGKILPPDSIELRFRIDADGYVVPSSISAIAIDPRHEDAAHCMRRELGLVTFRAPASARGVGTWVNATVPSVD